MCPPCSQGDALLKCVVTEVILLSKLLLLLRHWYITR